MLAAYKVSAGMCLWLLGERRNMSRLLYLNAWGKVLRNSLVTSKVRLVNLAVIG